MTWQSHLNEVFYEAFTVCNSIKFITVNYDYEKNVKILFHIYFYSIFILVFSSFGRQIVLIRE